MFDFSHIDTSNKESFYKQFMPYIEAVVEGEYDMIANMANISALLFHMMPDVNWAGFYIYKEDQLVLGPFQGLPACIRIPMGKGVCGTAAATRETQLVEDVHQFPGHIACDGDTNSEIVIPIIINDHLRGVLDIDSPVLNRFDDVDKRYLEQCVQLLTQAIKA